MGRSIKPLLSKEATKYLEVAAHGAALLLCGIAHPIRVLRYTLAVGNVLSCGLDVTYVGWIGGGWWCHRSGLNVDVVAFSAEPGFVTSLVDLLNVNAIESTVYNHERGVIVKATRPLWLHPQQGFRECLHANATKGNFTTMAKPKDGNCQQPKQSHLGK